jgi:hypothetical protein
MIVSFLLERCLANNAIFLSLASVRMLETLPSSVEAYDELLCQGSFRRHRLVL